MEVSFSNADLAAILQRPQQQRLELDRLSMVTREGLDAKRSEGDAIRQLIVRATKLGGRLDVTG